MRPAAVAKLNVSQCTLPKTGWGRLDLEESAPRAGAQWTDDGQTHEDRSLKHRSKKTVRPVPIPPEHVRLLSKHIEEYGTAPDGRLFRSRRAGAGILSESTYGRVWKDARAKALGEKAKTPLAKRPYDLRHAGVSLLLAAGVDPAEIAARAGHGIEVLLRVYAKCIDGKSKAQNKKIDDALADDATEDEDDTEGE
jgi:integrase